MLPRHRSVKSLNPVSVIKKSRSDRSERPPNDLLAVRNYYFLIESAAAFATESILFTALSPIALTVS